jgi:hypothetical protein
VLWGVGLERIVLGGNCCVVCVWKKYCLVLTVLWCVGLERIVLDGNCAVRCGYGTDCVGW